MSLLRFAVGVSNSILSLLSILELVAKSTSIWSVLLNKSLEAPVLQVVMVGLDVWFDDLYCGLV